MARRFAVVKEHIMTAMHLDDPKRIDTSLEDMENELVRGFGAPVIEPAGRSAKSKSPIWF